MIQGIIYLMKALLSQGLNCKTRQLCWLKLLQQIQLHLQSCGFANTVCFILNSRVSHHRKE